MGSARRRPIINLRRIFRPAGGPSGLDFALLAAGLAAGTVIIASLTDVAPAPSRVARAKPIVKAPSPAT
jgi:hypothetical protein